MMISGSSSYGLVRFFARSAPAVSLAPCGQLAEVVTAALGGHGAAFAPQCGSGGQFGLGKKIIGEGQSGTEQFTAPPGAILWEFWRQDA